MRERAPTRTDSGSVQPGALIRTKFLILPEVVTSSCARRDVREEFAHDLAGSIGAT
eukprot:COSAG05_NODE_20461_length_279_cov_0.577778_1_plen_55_part_10